MPQEKKKKTLFDPQDGSIINVLPSGKPLVDPLEQDMPKFPSGRPLVDPQDDNFFSRKLQEFAGTRVGQATISTLSPVLDVLSRGQYGSAMFADALANDSKSILDAISEGFSEAFETDPKKRAKLTYSDVIKRRFPEFARENPKSTSIIGFIGDIAFDPLTYLGAGLAKNGIRVGGKVLNQTGREILEEGLLSTSRKVIVKGDGTLDILTQFPRLQQVEEKLSTKIDRLVAKGKAVTPEVVEKYTEAFRQRVLAEAELKNAGYFTSLIRREKEVGKFLGEIVDNPDADLIKTIAKDETLKDLKRIGKDRLPTELMEDEVRERLETRIFKLLETSPQTAREVFAPKGLYLKVGVPFGPQKDVVRLLGLESLSKHIGALGSYLETNSKLYRTVVKPFQLAGQIFDRNSGLPKEYIKFRDDLENELGYITDRMIRTTRKLFTNVDEKGRERIGEMMHYVDDQTRLLETRIGRELNDEEAAKLVQNAKRKYKLDPEERAIVSTLYQDYKEAALLEMRAGLLKGKLQNYAPRGYELIADPDEFSFITRGKYGSAIPETYLSSSNTRKFLTKAEAEAQGLIPELDAALLYAHRLISSKRALATKQFRDNINELFGTTSTKAQIAHTGILPTANLGYKIPKNVIDDMRLIGESIYPSGLSDTSRQLIKLFDGFQSIFRRGATVARPSFAPKQLVSNTFQAALISGLKAFKALDPRVAADAALLMITRGKPTTSLPAFLNNFVTNRFLGDEQLLAGRTIMSKIFGDEQLVNFAKDYRMRSSLGQEFGGEELVQLARENGIIRDIDSTGDAFTRRITNELTKDQTTYKNAVGSMMKFWHHASMVEDYSRMMLFLNGMRMGYSADDAAKLVNKALFDYSRGLSKTEREIRRYLIPFYTFQRFALPFVFKQSLKQPGNPATIQKILGTAEKLLVNGEELNPSERDVLGDSFLLGQPNLMSGFDKNGTAGFNILNNLTPFDVLNIFSTDKDGNIDYKKTAERGILGAFAPYIKTIYTAKTGRDYFTDKVIADASRVGDLEGSIGKVIPSWVKELLQWETKTDIRTGKTYTYFAPFPGYYAMQLFPALRDYIRPYEEYKSESSLAGALFSAMKFIETVSPVTRKEYDIKREQILQVKREVSEIDRARAELRKAILQGSNPDIGKYDPNDPNQKPGNQYQRNLKSLIDYIKALQENQARKTQFEVRGQGFNKDVPEEQRREIEREQFPYR